MAIAVIFDLGFATVLTLVLVPTFYRISEDLKFTRVKIGTLVGRLVRRAPEPAPDAPPAP